MINTSYRRTDARLGEFAIRPLDPDADGALLHSWVTHPKASFWEMKDLDVAAVVGHYRAIADSTSHEAMIGLHNGQPTFLLERYDPAAAPVGKTYTVQPGDIGMHFLVAPTDAPISGFTRAAIATVMAFLFTEPSVRRVVVEPDVRNAAVHALNATVGFRVAGTVAMPTKRALLSICGREHFEAATSAPTHSESRS